MSKVFWHLFLTKSINSLAFFADAPPRLMKKFACKSEICILPSLYPLSPKPRSMMKPAEMYPSRRPSLQLGSLVCNLAMTSSVGISALNVLPAALQHVRPPPWLCSHESRASLQGFWLADQTSPELRFPLFPAISNSHKKT